MMTIISSQDEARRLGALRRYAVLDTPPEQALDDLVKLAAQICEAPIALLSLVDGHRQWFKAKVGLEMEETAREVSFCAHALGQTELFIVPDATLDARFASNPMVTGEPGIRFYAGAPLVTPEGEVLGALCVKDRVPRAVTEAQKEALQVLARQAMSQLELRRQTRELVANERQLRAIFDNEPECVKLLGPHCELMEMNPAGLRIIEADSLTQVAGHSVLDLILPEYRAAFADLTERVMRGESGQMEFEIQGLKGTHRWLETHAAPLRNEQGEITSLLGITRDITERKLAQETLRERTTQLQAALGMARMGAWYRDFRSDEITAVQGSGPVTGLDAAYSPRTGADFMELVHPEDRDAVLGSVERARAGENYEAEFRVVLPDGSIRWVAARGQCVRDAHGAAIGLTGVDQDITERKRSEEALRESRERFEALAQHSIQGITLVQDDRVIYVNPAVTAISGYSEEEATQRSLTQQYELIHPEDRARLLAKKARFEAGESVENDDEIRILRKDGEWRWIRSATKSFRLQGRPARLSMMVDIHERKQSEAALREREEQMRLYAEHSPAAVAMLDCDMRYLVVSRRWMEDYRLGDQPIVGRSHYEVFPNLSERWIEIHRRCLAGAVEKCDGEAFTRADGTIDWLRWEIRPWSQADGAIGGILIFSEDITSSKQAEAALRASEANYRTLVESAADGILVSDAQGRMLDVNAEACRMLGYTREEFLALTNADIVAEADLARIGPEMARLMVGKVVRSEWECRRKDGTVFPAEVSATLLPDGRLLGVTRDCTERQRAEHRIQQLNRVYAVLSGINETIVREKDPGAMMAAACRIAVEKGRFCFAWIGLAEASTGRLQITTYAGAPDDTIEIIRSLVGGERPDCAFTWQAMHSGRHGVCNDIASDPDADSWRDAALQRGYRAMASLPLKAGEKVVGTFNLYAGRAGFFSAEEMALLDELAMDISFALDVSAREVERRRVEQALTESEERFRLFMDNSPTIAWIKDQEGHYVYLSRTFEERFGVRLEDWRGKTDADLWQPGMGEHLQKNDRTVLDSNQAIVVTEETGNADGTICYWLSSKFPFRDAAGHRFVAGVALDITARKRVEERMGRLIESDIQGVIFWNKNGGITEANDAFLKMVGYTREDLAGGRVNWKAMTPPEFTEADERAAQELAATGVCTAHEKECLRKDGSRVPILIGAASFRDTPDEGVSFVLDLTERKKLEQQFLRSQRMDSIGTLAGGIAHDLNNMLSPIMMSLAVLEMRFPDPASKELLSIISASAQRGADLVRQVLSFARGVEGRRMEVEVRQLIQDIEKIANDTFLKNIQVRTMVPRDLWTVQGDPTQLHQVLLNLCVNARDAMPGGGALTISAENVTLDEHYSRLDAEAKPGRYVFLQVEDTGTGIPPALIEKIFDPFFTTKEVGRGTGLGLSTSLGIVKSHGGFMRVYSEPGKGTKFGVHLPARAENSEAAVAAAAAEMPRGNGQSILVVDDEESVRKITQQTLEAFDYRVLLASDGAEAIAVYAAHRTDIALVLTDMTMPVMDGAATIRVLRTLNATLPIIAASGLSDSGQTNQMDDLGVKHFLPKPYTAETLLKALKQALADES